MTISITLLYCYLYQSSLIISSPMKCAELRRESNRKRTQIETVKSQKRNERKNERTKNRRVILRDPQAVLIDLGLTCSPEELDILSLPFVWLLSSSESCEKECERQRHSSRSVMLMAAGLEYMWESVWCLGFDISFNILTLLACLPRTWLKEI